MGSVSRTADHLVIVLILFGANRLRACQIARLERQGVQEGRQRSQGRGHHRRREEARGEQDVTSRSDFFFAAALSLLTIASRPSVSRLLYNWDAVQFASHSGVRRSSSISPTRRATSSTSSRARRQRLARRSDGVYVTLAVAFSGMTTFVVYYLARAVYDRTTALAAAALLAVSPLFWFYGSVGLTYAGEALFASTVAYFGFRALNGSRSDAYLAAWYLGIAGLAPVAARPALSALDRLRGAGRATAPGRAGGPRHPDRVGPDLVRADDLAHRRPRPLRRRVGRAGGLDRQADVDRRRPRRGHAAHVALPAGVRARRPRPSGRGRLPSRLVRPPLGLDIAGVVLAGLDGPAGARVHARAFRPGRLRADVPAGAGDLPLACWWRSGARRNRCPTRGRAWRSRRPWWRSSSW